MIRVHRDREHGALAARVSSAWWTANLAVAAFNGKLPALRSLLDQLDTRPQSVSDMKAVLLTAAAKLPGVRIRKGKRKGSHLGS